MKQEKFPKRYKRWRSEGLLKAPYVMSEVLEATAWYSSFRFYLELIVLLDSCKWLEITCFANLYR